MNGYDSVIPLNLESRPIYNGPQAERLSVEDSGQNIPQESPQYDQPPRQLKQRHVQMIAIAGTLGAGLFLGSGQALNGAGPLGALIVYCLVGTVTYSTLCSLGEMASFAPISGSFPYYAARWVDPALGFAVGWNYFYSNAVSVPVELTGVQILTQYYYALNNGTLNCSASYDTAVMSNTTIPEVDPRIAYLVTFVSWTATCVINMFGARWFGEAEFWFSIMKCNGLIVTGLVIDLGGAPKHDRLGFRYWINPGLFAQSKFFRSSVSVDRFLGMLSVFVQAGFSFQGMEISAIAAAETESPRRNMIKAIRKSFFRILIFYIFGVFITGLIVPYNSPALLQMSESPSFMGATKSPYVIAMQAACIRVLPHVVNAGLITSAFSAGNSLFFAASRILYGLAVRDQAPSVFLWTKNGVPMASVLFTGSFGLLSFMTISERPQKAFQWLVNLSAVGGFLAWATINLTYIFFYLGMKRQRIDRRELGCYWNRFQPWLSIWGLAWCTIFVIFAGFQVFWKFGASDFFSAYVNVPIFIGLYLFWKITRKTAMWTPEEMDFETDIPKLEDTETPYKEPNGFWEKLADKIF